MRLQSALTPKLSDQDFDGFMKVKMQRSLENARNELVSDIRGLEFVSWGHGVHLMVRTNPFEQPAHYTVIPTHKLILCARSPVFLAMLTGQMREALEMEVVIDDCSPAAIKSLVSFMYSGSLTFTCVSHCADVHTAADKNAVTGLIHLCETYMHHKVQFSDFTVGVDEFLLIWSSAEQKNLSTLETACLRFLVRNGKQAKERWSYPSFLTHEQALKVIRFSVDNLNIDPQIELPFTDNIDY